MTTGTWEPLSEKGSDELYTLEINFLKQLAGRITQLESASNDDATTPNILLSHDEQQSHIKIMTLPKESWFSISDELSEHEVILLIKFFTLAEKHINHWQAEEKSPVIWLSKILRKKGGTLDQQLLQWIKRNSDNKFLPYGPL